MKAALKTWLPLAVLATFLVGIAFGVGQQVLRQSANDPQIQLAEDWANQIESSTNPQQLNLGAFIDPAHSLAPYGIIYDQDGNIIGSSVSAPSTMKQPDGVFDRVDATVDHEVRFTWQPASGDRYAVVIKRATIQDKLYYVLAGRNLREVEARNNKLMWMVAMGWAITIAALLVLPNLHLVGRVLTVARKK
jgi:hypothetical protein